MKIALLSDTHIDADPSRVLRGQDTLENFRAVAHQVMSKNPEAIIINGDIANNPDDNAYERFKTVVDHLPNVYLLAGNHDGSKLDHCVGPRQLCFRGCNWCFVDSQKGSIGDEQLVWLETLNYPSIVMTHYAIFPKAQTIVGPYAEEMGQPAIEDEAKFLDVILSNPAINICITGHIHQFHIKYLRGTYFVSLPPTGYVFRPKDPLGWVLVDLKKESISFELQCLGEPHYDYRKTIRFRSSEKWYL